VSPPLARCPELKRFHVHLSVKDLSESIRFYSKLFGIEPTVTKDDYAKWMLNDPHINFAILSAATLSA
jgi:catechol-2,3-dioxygenase